MSGILTEIVGDTREAVASRRLRAPLAQLIAASERRRADADPDARRDFAGALARPGLALIAEHKRSSPSAGVIRSDVALADVVGAYERAGAAALSVLTEERRFHGSLDDLGEARRASRLPILRKDFIVDPYQVHEALAGGADAILLIVAALQPDALAELQALAGRLGLAVLMEIHNADELETALALRAPIIGINNRNLVTMQVDVETTYELLPEIPDGTLKVAESGLRTRAELERLTAAGVDAVLIGEALMRCPDIEAGTRELLGSGL